MRVLFIRSNPVSPDPRVEKEVNSLLKRGHEVSVLCWDRSKTSKKTNGKLFFEYGDASVERICIKSDYGNGLKNLIPLIKFQFKLAYYLVRKIKSYDCIHACDFDTILPPMIISKIFKKKLVYDIFDYYVDAFSVPKLIKPIVEAIDIRMINNADAVIITNETRVQQINKSKPKILRVIHNSPKNHIPYKNSFGNLNNSKLKIAYFGILAKGRMLEEVIDLMDRRNDLELHIGGFGILENDVIRAANKNKNIYFYGKVPYETVIDIEGQCDVLFATYDPNVPNHKYSSPNKLYEAMMLGKPIIAVKNTGIDNIIEGYKLGKLIEYDRESFEEVVNDLNFNRPNLNEMYNHARQVYMDHYSWDIMEYRLCDLYECLQKR